MVKRKKGAIMRAMNAKKARDVYRASCAAKKEELNKMDDDSLNLEKTRLESKAKDSARYVFRNEINLLTKTI
jgi:hypothetical protein